MDRGHRAIKDVMARHSDVAEGMGRLVDHCAQRYPHPVWKEVRRLDYVDATEAMQGWFLERLPIPARVQVLWFALWDMTTGFDLRGSSRWSRDPDDWEWWYHDDFYAGSHESRPLEQMHELARRVEDPDDGPDVEGGVWELMDDVLTLGYISLAAQQIMRGLDAGAFEADDELAVVSGFPDAGYGLILGRLTDTGFEAGDAVYRHKDRKTRRPARGRRVAEARVYRLAWDESETDGWLLDDPVDRSGKPLELGALARGATLDVDGELFIPLLRSGAPLDLSVAPLQLVAGERIASLLTQLAPQDLQRIPARVQSASGRYDFLHTLSWLDCVDRERTEAWVFVEGEGETRGTLASLAPLLEARPELEVSVRPSGIRLRTERLAGARIFRVEESGLFPMVTHEVRAALEREGARGVAYAPVA